MIPSNFREKENQVTINIKKVAEEIKHMPWIYIKKAS